MVGWVATGVDPVSSHEAPHPAAGVCFAGHEGLVSTSKIVGNEQSRPLLPGLSRGRLSYRGQMVCFLMFFVTCLSLGYQTLWRYDPRRHPALAEFSFCDPHSYYCMVQSDYSRALAPYRFRILGPGLASLIYRVLPPDRIGHADPVYFSLLMVNSIVMALACLAIMRLGQQTGQSLTAGCIGAFFYLASWCVANLTLGGVYIDSFEIPHLVSSDDRRHGVGVAMDAPVVGRRGYGQGDHGHFRPFVDACGHCRCVAQQAESAARVAGVVAVVRNRWNYRALCGARRRRRRAARGPDFSWKRLAGMLYGYRMFLPHTFYIAVGPLAARKRFSSAPAASTNARGIIGPEHRFHPGIGLCRRRRRRGKNIVQHGGAGAGAFRRHLHLRPVGRSPGRLCNQSGKSAVRTGTFPERIADLRGTSPWAPSGRQAA